MLISSVLHEFSHSCCTICVMQKDLFKFFPVSML